MLADGEVMRTKGVPSPLSGPSLTELFIGSEGTMGVITEATIRALSAPQEQQLIGLTFPDFESGFHAVSQIFRDGIRPAMVDYGDESLTGDPYEKREAVLYAAFDGLAKEVTVQVNHAIEVSRRFGGSQCAPEEVQTFWNTRHSSADRYKRDVLESADPGRARKSRSSYRMEYLHVAIPVSNVLDYRSRCQEILSSRRVMVKEWSLWGRPEFFSFLLAEEDQADDNTSLGLADTVDEVLKLAQEMGGTMEYCHGVGIKLAHLMESELGSGMSVLRRVKSALDPNGIMNPGKLGL